MLQGKLDRLGSVAPLAINFAGPTLPAITNPKSYEPKNGGGSPQSEEGDSQPRSPADKVDHNKNSRRMDLGMIYHMRERLKFATRLKGVDERSAIDKIFRQYDKDRSGFMDVAELTRACRIELRIPAEQMSDEDIQIFVRELDPEGKVTSNAVLDFLLGRNAWQESWVLLETMREAGGFPFDSKMKAKGRAKQAASAAEKALKLMDKTRIKSLHSMSRAELIEACYGRLKEHPQQQYIGARQMRVLADLLEFNGNDVEWEDEYKELCLDAGDSSVEGITIAGFKRILNDRQSTCSCSDTELKKVISQLDRGTKSLKQIMGLSRPEMIFTLFQALLKPPLKSLKKDQLAKYAELCGFEGSTLDWEMQYGMICEDYDLPIDGEVHIHKFGEMLQDPVDGAEVDDAALRRMLEELNVDHSLFPMAVFTWEDLLRKVIRHCKPTNHSRLDMKGMKRFVELLGWVGAPADWPMEYLAMCADRTWDERKGAGRQELVDLCRDERGQCYCDVKRLRSIVVSLLLDGEETDSFIQTREETSEESEEEVIEQDTTKKKKKKKKKTVEQMQSETHLDRKIRDDAASRIQRIVRRRLSKPITLLEPDFDLRQLDASRLRQVQSDQEASIQELKAWDNPENTIIKGRATLGMLDFFKEDLKKLGDLSMAKIEDPTRSTAQEAIKQILAGRPSRIISSKQIEIAKKTVRRAPNKKGDKKGTEPRLVKLNRPPPLTSDDKRIIGNAFRGVRAPAHTALLKACGKQAVDGCVTDKIMVSLIRKVWNIKMSALSDLQIGGLCQVFDPEGTNQVPLKDTIEWVLSKKLSDAEIELLKCSGEDNEPEDAKKLAKARSLDGMSSDESSSDEVDFNDPKVQREIRLAAKNQALPAKTHVTHAYLNGNPNFLFLVIKKKNEDYTSHVIERLTFRGINQTDLRGCTALHIAADYDLGLTCTKLLNRESFCGANAVDYKGWTALHRAARSGAESACKGLLSHPRFTLLDAIVPNDGWTALHFAAMHGHANVVYHLVSNNRVLDVAKQDCCGRSPLHCATESGQGEAIQALLGNGRYSNNQLFMKNKWNETAFQTAKDGAESFVGQVLRTVLKQRQEDERKGRGGDTESEFRDRRGQFAPKTPEPPQSGPPVAAVN